MTEPVLLHTEDRHRMIRLYEEVLTRLEEMAMITGRTLGLDTDCVFEVRFRPLSANPDGPNVVELFRGGVGSACYDYNRGVCFHHDPLRPVHE